MSAFDAPDSKCEDLGEPQSIVSALRAELASVAQHRRKLLLEVGLLRSQKIQLENELQQHKDMLLHALSMDIGSETELIATITTGTATREVASAHRSLLAERGASIIA